MSKIQILDSSSKITISVLLLLLFSFLLVIFFINTYSSEVENNKDAFFKQTFGLGEKKIFLIGSSQTAQINESFIQKSFLNSNSNYKIYNLGYGEDSPNSRSQYVDDIISTQPEIIVYGLGFRDFAKPTWINTAEQSCNDWESQRTCQERNFLPEPEKIFLELKRDIGTYLEFDFENFKYPRIITKTITGKLISSSNEYKTTEYGGTETKPFWPSFDYLGTKRSGEELKELYERQCSRNDRRCATSYETINPSIVNQEIVALKEIIKKFQENEIKIIVFSTPHNDYYLDSLGQVEIQNFELILSMIRDEFNIPVYELHQKYVNDDIWYDNSHVALGNEDITYNLDIGQIILEETKN